MSSLFSEVFNVTCYNQDMLILSYKGFYYVSASHLNVHIREGYICFKLDKIYEYNL